MSNRIIRYSCLCAAVCLTLFASPGASAGETPDSARANAKLAELRWRIAALTSRLGGELKDRDTLAARLREADLGLTAKRRRLDGFHSAQLAAERRRVELRAEQTRTQNTLDAQRTALAAQVRAAYMIGRQAQVKLLLNQSDPASAGRMLTLYGYFVRARGARIGAISEHAVRVQQLVGELAREAATLQGLQIDAAREMTDLQRAREERVLAVAAVTKEVSSGNRELSQLQREEQAEESLVADLARVLQDFPVAQQSFAGLRGKLPWPVQGRMTMRYQDPRAAAPGFRRNGVLIQSTRGAKVRAPYFGRVVYADWLQGLGLLLIIGHGGNYMTLYGHAGVLYKSVGDRVAPGDVIAALSDSSGAAPQLYFEIREGRKNVDPRAWLRPP